MGRLSRSLSSYGGVDFNAFLTGMSAWLGHDQPLWVDNKSQLPLLTHLSRLRILKRRLAWLIGQWVTSEEECAKSPLVWQILVHLLADRSEASDKAVQLTAATAIKECVDVSTDRKWLSSG